VGADHDAKKHNKRNQKVDDALRDVSADLSRFDDDLWQPMLTARSTRVSRSLLVNSTCGGRREHTQRLWYS
jgi:hypothetical protein